MTKLARTIEVHRPPSEAFTLVADFTNSAKWDPGVASATQTANGRDARAGVGARYDLDVIWRGRHAGFRFEVTSFDPPHRIELEGDGTRVASTDVITFEPTEVGTRITYTADLRFKGILKPLEVLMRKEFDRTADEALAGMKSWLATQGSARGT